MYNESAQHCYLYSESPRIYPTFSVLRISKSSKFLSKHFTNYIRIESRKHMTTPSGCKRDNATTTVITGPENKPRSPQQSPTITPLGIIISFLAAGGCSINPQKLRIIALVHTGADSRTSLFGRGMNTHRRGSLTISV